MIDCGDGSDLVPITCLRTDHVPDWTSIAHADVPDDEPTFDVWCLICGESGSFALEAEDVNWL